MILYNKKEYNHLLNSSKDLVKEKEKEKEREKAIQLEKTGAVPTYVADNVLIYGDTPGIGTSGIWFVNDSAEAAKQNGELISKNRALVFSMLF